MDMQPVKSSALAAVGYDAATKELHVEYRNGGKYKYAGVSPEQHKALMASDSHGKHFAQHIRAKHAFTKY